MLKDASEWYFRCPKEIGNPHMIIYWPYVHFEEIEKNQFFWIFSSFEADFVKEFLIKWVVDDKK